MMARWMLADRKLSADFYSLEGVQSVADVVRHSRLLLAS